MTTPEAVETANASSTRDAIHAFRPYLGGWRGVLILIAIALTAALALKLKLARRRGHRAGISHCFALPCHVRSGPMREQIAGSAG
jgi:anti-sigma-K factor RskA